LQKRKFEKGKFNRSMRPEHEFGHLDRPGESGGGADAWNADAALLPPSPTGSFSPGGTESHTTSLSLKKLRLFCF
jgi:hypothetical protein